jgi:hypothetical protein
MAVYQILYWKEFPSQVMAREGKTLAKGMLSDRFQQAIDAAAMSEGSTDMDSYVDAYTWGPQQTRDGTPDEVLRAVLAEIEAEYPPSRLAEMIRARA